MYGGAAGGGKSDALLMAALQYAHVPGYAAILFRRTYADLSLPGALMDRAADWLGGKPGTTWNDNDKRWTFPSGATLTFGYLQTPADRYRYQSSEFQLIGFDELTQFEESSYRYLFSRLRRHHGVKTPLRMRSATNPGGRGHAWVKDRFITHPEDRVFVPARLEDNPHIDQVQYLASLAELDPHTRNQLRSGDWDAVQGEMFQRHWFPVVDRVPDDLRLLRAWDLAATAPRPGRDPDWTVGVLLGRCEQGFGWVLDVRRERASAAGVEELIRRTAAEDGPRVAVWMEQEPGSSGVITVDHYRRHVLPGVDFHAQRSTGDKSSRARPVASAAEVGNVRLRRANWNKALLDEVEGFPSAAHDDQVDALSLAWSKLFAGPWDLTIHVSPRESSIINRLPEGVFLS